MAIVHNIALTSLALSGLACGGGGNARDSGLSEDGASAIDARALSDSRPEIDAEECEPPDMLIVLDRTMSMHRRPDGSRPADADRQQSKWYIAITALEAVTAALDQTIRFGVELFPRDPGNNVCVTLSERINNITATNTACEGAEIPVSPSLVSSVAINGALDPETTRLCTSTPIGAGLASAQIHLAGIRNPVRGQFALLLTDGQDTCGSSADPVANAQALAADGVELYVIGFDANGGTGVDHEQLNHLACAGRTAPGFPAPCVDDGAGNFSASAPSGTRLYLLAGNAAELQTQLEQVAGEICCNCIE